MNSDKPSSTAILIAKSQAYLAKNKNLSWAVSEEYQGYYKIFLREICQFRFGILSDLRLFLIEKISIPGIYLHYALRKMCIRQNVLELIEKSQVRQIVVIAAGFDPLAVDLSKKYPNIKFIEIDHPATQKYKKLSLVNYSNIPENLNFVSIDLTKEKISTAFIDPNLSTIFIAEGITMYLDEKQITDFFGQIKSLIKNPQSYFLFSYMNKNNGRIQFENASFLVDIWLLLKKEIFKWGIENSKISDFVKKLGFDLAKIYGYEYFNEKFLRPRKLDNVTLASGEYLCLTKIIYQK